MASARDLDHRNAATHAGLLYVTDGLAGITRKRVGKGWAYYAPDGARIADRETRKRLDRLAIPPAWTDVWICPDPAGHIQATARDARGRKQYRYHASYREARDQSKFRRMLEFSEALPQLRERVAGWEQVTLGEQDDVRLGRQRVAVLTHLVAEPVVHALGVRAVEWDEVGEAAFEDGAFALEVEGGGGEVGQALLDRGAGREEAGADAVGAGAEAQVDAGGLDLGGVDRGGAGGGAELGAEGGAQVFGQVLRIVSRTGIVRWTAVLSPAGSRRRRVHPHRPRGSECGSRRVVPIDGRPSTSCISPSSSGSRPPR